MLRRDRHPFWNSAAVTDVRTDSGWTSAGWCHTSCGSRTCWKELPVRGISGRDIMKEAKTAAEVFWWWGFSFLTLAQSDSSKPQEGWGTELRWMHYQESLETEDRKIRVKMWCYTIPRDTSHGTQYAWCPWNCATWGPPLGVWLFPSIPLTESPRAVHVGDPQEN